MAALGLIFAVFTSSQAILLDALFNLTYLIAGLFTLKVARLVHREDDERFPYGYAYFEPLMNGVKGLLVLGVSLAALAGAVRALFTGGREIEAGLAVLYALGATLGCRLLALLVRRGARRSHSPLLTADAENWTVNTAISACVLLAFGSILLLRGTRFAAMIPYVDPLIVLAVVVISLSVPVRMAWQALMELLNRAPRAEITAQVRAVIEDTTGRLPVQELFVRVLQPGRTRLVLAHAVLPASHRVESLAVLDAVRAETAARLTATHPSTILDLIFTADRQWGAPVGVHYVLEGRPS